MKKQPRLLDAKQMPYMPGTMTNLNHLGESLLAKPDAFEDIIGQIFASKNYYSENPLSAVLKSMGSTLTISSNSHEWKLMGGTTRPLVVVEDKEVDNTSKGKGRQEFKVKLDENWFIPGDVISPGNPAYQCRVQHDSYREGNGFVYTLRLVSDNAQAFVPNEFFTVGTAWSKLFASYGEADVQDGSTTFSAPLTLSTKIGKLRKKYEVTDYAMEQVLAVKIRDAKGNLYDRWVRYAEAEYWSQWEREKEIALWYSRAASSIKNVKSYTVDSFPGIQEQLEDGLTYTYNKFTPKLLNEFMMDCFYGRVKPGKTRKLKAYTGEYGMKIFHDAMLSQTGQPTAGAVQVISSSFSPIEKVSSEFHSNAYSVGYQFVQYKMYNGSILELVHNPLYDDRSINTEIDPVTGYPLESMRFTFLDFDSEGGTNNIQMIEKKDGFKYGYVAGLISPSGPTMGGNMSHSGEFYSMHASKEFGVKITDVTRCGELICARN